MKTKMKKPNKPFCEFADRDWEEHLSEIKCWHDSDIDEIADWIADNMRMYSRESNEESVPASDDERKVARALYSGILHAIPHCGLLDSYHDFDKISIALNAAEFAFIDLHPTLNSYTSFFIPIARVTHWMLAHHEELACEYRRRREDSNV